MQNLSNENQKSSESIDIRRYLILIWHWVWLIVPVAVFAAFTAYIFTQDSVPIYKASTILMIDEAPGINDSTYTTNVQSAERMIRTFSQLMLMRPFLSEVALQANILSNPEALRSVISIQQIQDTSLMQISVNSNSPAEAAILANTVAMVFIEQLKTMQSERFATSKKSLESQIEEISKQITATTEQLSYPGADGSSLSKDRLEVRLSLQQQIYGNLILSYEQLRLSEAQTTSTITQVEPAIQPTTPINPSSSKRKNALMAAGIAAVLLIGIIFAFEALDDSIKNPETVTNILGLSIVGVIVHHTIREEGKPVTEIEPRSSVSESFRTLRTNVQYASVDHPIKTILVTSPVPKEGKTTIVTNLGIVLAQSGLRVVLIDADMHRPSLHRKLDLRNQVGLSSVFVRPGITLSGIVQDSRVENLTVITSGRIPPNPSELLGSQKMHNLMEKLKEEFDIILIDTPPALAVTDAVVLAPFVDGVLLVFQPGFTKFAAARQTKDQIKRVGANVIGAVLNNIRIRRSNYGYYYEKGYYYSSDYYYEAKSDTKENPKKKGKSTL